MSDFCVFLRKSNALWENCGCSRGEVTMQLDCEESPAAHGRPCCPKSCSLVGPEMKTLLLSLQQDESDSVMRHVLASRGVFKCNRNWWFSESAPLHLAERWGTTNEKKTPQKTELQAVSRPSELIGNQQQHGGSSSQVPAVYWKEMRKHLESPRWDCDADRLAPPRPTRLIYKVIAFIWWLLVLPRPADGSTPGSVSFCVSASWRQLSLCTAETPHT